MYRNELKFIINAHQKQLLTNKLGHLCRRDSFSDPAGGYLISSLYFDDYNQSAFFDKAHGIRKRKKFRIRAYNYQSNVIKLERKIKRGKLTDKKHLRISEEEYQQLVRGEVSFLSQLDDGVAQDFYLNYRTKNLRSRVVVEYRREAFVYPYGDVRICFDTLLKAGNFQEDLFSNQPKFSVLPPDQIILEVKYTGYLPDVIRNPIQLNNLHRQSISKYAKCFAFGL